MCVVCGVWEKQHRTGIYEKKGPDTLESHVTHLRLAANSHSTEESEGSRARLRGIDRESHRPGSRRQEDHNSRLV